uniref:O-fucosyltransferase family protein n=1 Tax=Pseudo-nitzschia australis TaxID=44445 RepID=A0A7S4ACZ5_9STRA|mmetsp:Transcript_13516/g.28337  ORF Transcript_13516/g.28337 Transcript_13516/m.28337 type:complete len:659 (+) Transcript_13516:68-2044(+)
MTSNRKEEKSKSTTTTTRKNVGRKKGGGTGLNDWFIGIFGVAFVVSLSLNVMHLTIGDAHEDTNDIGGMGHSSNKEAAREALLRTMRDFRDNSASLKERRKRRMEKMKPLLDVDENSVEALDSDGGSDVEENSVGGSDIKDGGDSVKDGKKKLPLATLNCKPWGISDESNKAAQEMVYWQDIPSDSYYTPPFYEMNHQKGKERKYMTFEPDGGGWNNIRMAMESTIAIALATGRTLVMPPQKKMYLLGAQKGGQKHHFNFVDFFPIERMATDNKAFEVVSMQEYLEEEALKGKLVNKETGKVEFPPGNRTDWDGIDQKDYDDLRFYLRSVSHTLEWRPSKCLPAFPSSGNHEDVEILQKLAGTVTKLGSHHHIDGTELFKVDDPNPLSRLEDTLSGRKKLCVYDEGDQNEKVVHFQMNHKEGLRLLTHFYSFLFFEDWREDLWMKRIVRDHLYYSDEIQCAAARIVEKVRDHKSKLTNGNSKEFISFHVRRGDFQFKDSWISIEKLIENTQDLIPANSVVFIATDERDKSYFEPMKKKYNLLFLDDFVGELKGVNSNYYGMIDQLVASRGSKFFGCWHSTFTSYIMRIRGYHSIKDKAEGYEHGTLPTTYYYTPKNLQLEMHKYSPIGGAFFNREFPTSWRDIDKGIVELASSISRHS